MSIAVPLPSSLVPPAALPPAPPADLPAATGRIPGSKAMWVGIFCEITEFSLLFAVFFVARAHNPEAF